MKVVKLFLFLVCVITCMQNHVSASSGRFPGGNINFELWNRLSPMDTSGEKYLDKPVSVYYNVTQSKAHPAVTPMKRLLANQYDQIAFDFDLSKGNRFFLGLIFKEHLDDTPKDGDDMYVCEIQLKKGLESKAILQIKGTGLNQTSMLGRKMLVPSQSLPKEKLTYVLSPQTVSFLGFGATKHGFNSKNLVTLFDISTPMKMQYFGQKPANSIYGVKETLAIEFLNKK